MARKSLKSSSSNCSDANYNDDLLRLQDMDIRTDYTIDQLMNTVKDINSPNQVNMRGNNI